MVPTQAVSNNGVLSHVRASPMEEKVTCYLAVFLLLSSWSLCSSGSPDGTSMTNREVAAMSSYVVNPFELVSNDMNVCTKTSLELATNYLTEDELVDGCDSMYLPTTCRALGSNVISIRDLYLRVDTYRCCDGFLREVNSCSKICLTSTYGPNCSMPCSCLHNGVCNPVDGSCDCQPGWMGEQCEQTCSSGRYGDRCMNTCQCQNGGSCHPETGVCLCLAGDFDLCGPCRQGYYDPSLDACRCRHGWLGRYCAHTCENNTHGDFCEETCRCINAVSCLPGDGRCVCLPGWVGASCDQKCLLGFHGEGCQERCACPDDGGCDHVTGTCDSCPRGWMGQLCTLQCEDDHWGENCSRDCNCAESLNCDPISGACMYIEGMESTTASIPPEVGRDGRIAAIVGSVVLLFILTIFGVVTIWCRSRRQPNLPRQHNALRANGTIGGHGTQTNTVTDGQANGTIRYEGDNESSASVPLPRGPSTFPRGVDPANNSDGYVPMQAPVPLPGGPSTFPRGVDPANNSDELETLQRDSPNPPPAGPPNPPSAPPNPPSAHPYIVIYDEIQDVNLDNPIYPGTDADGYQVPRPQQARAV